MTMGNLEQDYNMYNETGRTQIWKRGTRLFPENPIFGVGVNCSPEAIGVMRKKENLLEQWQVIIIRTCKY